MTKKVEGTVPCKKISTVTGKACGGHAVIYADSDGLILVCSDNRCDSKPIIAGSLLDSIKKWNKKNSKEWTI